MGARRVEDLVVFQLGAMLRNEIIALTSTPALEGRRKLCEQLCDAGGSVPANIAEGFGRYRPRDFAKFLRIANASTFEIRSHLADALARRAITAEAHAKTHALCRRTSIALTRLIRYLESCDPSGPHAATDL